MKTIPTRLEKQIREYLLNDFNEEATAEAIYEAPSNCIYLEFDDYTLDVEFADLIHKVEIDATYSDPSEVYYEGYIEVEEIRIYTEDEDYVLELDEELEKTLNCKL